MDACEEHPEILMPMLSRDQTIPGILLSPQRIILHGEYIDTSCSTVLFRF